MKLFKSKFRPYMKDSYIIYKIILYCFINAVLIVLIVYIYIYIYIYIIKISNI